MHTGASGGEDMTGRIDFQTDPSRYRHWRLAFDGQIAHLVMDVDENGGLFAGYTLKLKSYDLGVDIELADAIQPLHFAQPHVRVVGLNYRHDQGFLAPA